MNIKIYNSRNSLSAYIIAGILLTVSMIFLFFNCNAAAEQLDINIESKGNTSYLTDSSYSTGISYSSDDIISVYADSKIDALYIIWDSPVSEWELVSGDNSITCGKDGFLHELVKPVTPSETLSLHIKNNARICDIYAFSGDIPSFVQDWDALCSEADFLVFSTHADDEILFLGGVLATYGGEKNLPVQVCYMTNYWNGLHIREHEKLDGLWESGIKNYPVSGYFDDYYSETLDGAKASYDYAEVLEFVTGQIRTFTPNVVVTQDLNGEYGHGGHMLLAKAVTEAVDNSMDSSFFAEQADVLGTWDVPKTYLHLYENNPIWLNLNVPLNNLNGRTAIEAAKDAYLKHVSQQWCWFYVSDTYKYSCAKFGLYRSTVGPDTQTGYDDNSKISSSGGNMLENIITHEEARIIAKQEAESLNALELQSSIEASLAQSDITAADSNNNNVTSDKSGITSHIPAVIILAAMCLLLILALSLIVLIRKKH